MQAETQSVKPHFLDNFSKLSVPRFERCKLRPVDKILLLTVSGIMCDAENWEDIEELGLAKEALLKKLLPYKNGIPGETLFEVFLAIDYT